MPCVKVTARNREREDLHMAKKQKMSAKQLKEREERALERQRLAKEKEERQSLIKRIFVVSVCVILILALSLPTMGLMFLGGNQ